MCGEHFAYIILTLTAWGSSPHVRGAQMTNVLSDEAFGIIPACAGSTS